VIHSDFNLQKLFMVEASNDLVASILLFETY
jgi:hypothetical protein